MIKSLFLIARNSGTLKFIPNFREVIAGVIQPAGVITGVRVIAAPIVEAVLGFTIYVLASVRAIISVMVNNIVYQTSIKNLREYRMLAGLIVIEGEGHFIFPKDLRIGDALHMLRVEQIGVAHQVIIIGFRIKLIDDISLEEVKISFVSIIPSAVKAEILGEAGERYVSLCGGGC